MCNSEAVYSNRMCVVSACLDASESRFFLYLFTFFLDYETDDEEKGLLSYSEGNGKEY